MNITWIGPTDFCCEYCQNGFAKDDTVYLDRSGVSFHKQCVTEVTFYNTMIRGGRAIAPFVRMKRGYKPYTSEEIEEEKGALL